MTVQKPSSPTDIDESLATLSAGASALRNMTLDQRVDLIQQCIHGIGSVARDWVESACAAKRIPGDSPARTEEVTAGPLATIRFLQLIAQSLRDLRDHGSPRLPGPVRQTHGQCRVPVFPTKLLQDSTLFRPMTAETWLHPSVPADAVSAVGSASLTDPARLCGVAAVLGAGNVSSIPATDVLTSIFLQNNVVALKMNPVNEYLGESFQSGLKPLVDAGLLRIIYGGIESGKQLIASDRTDRVHITGSIGSHDNIVWGTDDDRQQRRAEHRPVLAKPMTSELGNVSPWAIIPGKYTEKQLRSQAELIATSITNNVSFNCIATKIILISRDWPQRERFHGLLSNLLRSTPLRYAYYPGAAERFTKFGGSEVSDPDRLPWTLLRDINPADTSCLLTEESFTPVCGEWVVDAESDVDFVDQVVARMNDQIWGTLSACFTVPDHFAVHHEPELDGALRRLRYGTIGINQWPALSFALMSPPWGGHPSSTLDDAQSGIGFVHNTFLLDQPEKTILRAPLCTKPKPIWDSTHRHPERVAWDLLRLYHSPSRWKMPRLCLSAFTG